ncbi:MAG: S26 family signal peptidase [Cyanobacteria bacterium P01_H01_bin.119]
MTWKLRHSALKDIVSLLLRRYYRLRVVGTSMMPLLQPGEEVLVQPVKAVQPIDNLAQLRKPSQGEESGQELQGAIALFPSIEPGDLVIARHPFKPELTLIKRVVGDRDDGSYILMGDNPEPGSSTDSRSFGAVGATYILGKVICRFP